VVMVDRITSCIVADLMTGDLVFVTPDHPLGDAREVLLASGLHVLPVLDNRGSAVGTLTLADLEDPGSSETVKSRMSAPVLTIDVNEPATRAARVMRDNYVHHLVVTEDGTTTGILSGHDLLFLIAEADD
jgi:CBS domain-containing protein